MNERSEFDSHIVPENRHVRRLTIPVLLRITESIRCESGRDRLDPIAGSQQNSAEDGISNMIL